MIKFSDKEVLILACLMEGLTDKQIAQRLGLSVYAVRTHLVRGVIHKTRCKNRTQAAVQGWLWGADERAKAILHNGHTIEKVSGTQVR